MFYSFYYRLLDPGVRDSSAEALGTAMKVVGEKAIMPFLPDLEAMKLAKIKECCEKAVISGRPAAGSAKPKAAAPAEAKGPAKPAPAATPVADSAPKRPATVVKKPAASSAAGGAAKKPAGKAPAKKSGPGAKAEEKTERELTPEEADEKAAAVLPPDVMSGLADSNWKTRLAAMESMMQVIVSPSFKWYLKENIQINILIQLTFKYLNCFRHWTRWRRTTSLRKR